MGGNRERQFYWNVKIQIDEEVRDIKSIPFVLLPKGRPMMPEDDGFMADGRTETEAPKTVEALEPLPSELKGSRSLRSKSVKTEETEAGQGSQKVVELESNRFGIRSIDCGVGYARKELAVRNGWLMLRANDKQHNVSFVIQFEDAATTKKMYDAMIKGVNKGKGPPALDIEIKLCIYDHAAQEPHVFVTRRGKEFTRLWLPKSGSSKSTLIQENEMTFSSSRASIPEQEKPILNLAQYADLSINNDKNQIRVVWKVSTTVTSRRLNGAVRECRPFSWSSELCIREGNHEWTSQVESEAFMLYPNTPERLDMSNTRTYSADQANKKRKREASKAAKATEQQTQRGQRVTATKKKASSPKPKEPEADLGGTMMMLLEAAAEARSSPDKDDVEMANAEFFEEALAEEQSRASKQAKHASKLVEIVEDNPATRRVTVWNPVTGKKLSGNAGVFKKNLDKYLRNHPEMKVWEGEDSNADSNMETVSGGEALSSDQKQESLSMDALVMLTMTGQKTHDSSDMKAIDNDDTQDTQDTLDYNL